MAVEGAPGLAGHLRPPQFWSRALRGQDAARCAVRRRDLPALAYLYDVRVTPLDGPGEGPGAGSDGAASGGSDASGGEGPEPPKRRRTARPPAPAEDAVFALRRKVALEFHFLRNPFFEDRVLWVAAAVERGRGSPLLTPPVAGGLAGSAALTGQSGVRWRGGARVTAGAGGAPRGSLFWLFEGGSPGVARALRADAPGDDAGEALGDLLSGAAAELVPQAHRLFVAGHAGAGADGETDLEDSDDGEGWGPAGPATTRELLVRATERLSGSVRGLLAVAVLVGGAVLVASGPTRPLRWLGAGLGAAARRALWHLRHGAHAASLLGSVATRGWLPVLDRPPLFPPRW